LNDAKEKVEFMKKPFELAKSSRQYIERFWKKGIDVSKFSASIASLFSSVLNRMVKTVVRVVSFNRGIHELFLTRFMFLPPFGLWSRKVTPPEEEYFPTEMGRANVSFLFNVTVAKKTAAELARRVAMKTPKPALLLGPAPLPEAEFIQETLEELVEKPAKTVPHIVADLKSRFKFKLAPNIKGISSALQEYSRKAISLAPLLTMPKPLLVGPLRLEGPLYHPLVSPPEKGTPSLPPTETKVEPPTPHAKLLTRVAVPPVSMFIDRLGPLTVGSLEYAAKLSSIVLERAIPILKRMVAFSLVSPSKPPLPSVEPSHRYPKPTTLPPMHPSQIGRVIEEISPSLTSWIYGVSEILRGTAFSLSAVPVAASTAERVVTETLIQPVSSFEAPKILGTQEPVSLGLAPSRPKTGVGRTEVEAFRLPAIVASLVVALSQRYPLLFSEPTISETYGTSYELTRVTPEETPTLGGIPEVKSFSKLPTVIALAAAESLIAHRLQREFSALATEIQVSRSSYGERLEELGTSRPTRPTTLGKLAALAPATPLSKALGSRPPQIPSRSRPLTRPGPMSPAAQNTFNITLSAESTEEDLRDLERKINKILSEQMRRYYGSPRI